MWMKRVSKLKTFSLPFFRYMVANRDIQPGEVVFQDRAAAVGPSESNPLCLDCNGKV